MQVMGHFEANVRHNFMVIIQPLLADFDEILHGTPKDYLSTW